MREIILVFSILLFSLKVVLMARKSTQKAYPRGIEKGGYGGYDSPLFTV